MVRQFCQDRSSRQGIQAPFNGNTDPHAPTDTLSNIVSPPKDTLKRPLSSTDDQSTDQSEPIQPLPYFIIQESPCRPSTMPIYWRNANEQCRRPQEIQLNTRFCQPSLDTWNSRLPADIMICAAFLATNPRLIPQDEYNLGDTHERAVTNSGLFSNSTDPPTG